MSKAICDIKAVTVAGHAGRQEDVCMANACMQLVRSS